MGLYICVMVVSCLYGYNRHGDRHKDREIGDMEIRDRQKNDDAPSLSGVD